LWYVSEETKAVDETISRKIDNAIKRLAILELLRFAVDLEFILAVFIHQTTC
jgi:hypothetical protein